MAKKNFVNHLNEVLVKEVVKELKRRKLNFEEYRTDVTVHGRKVSARSHFYDAAEKTKKTLDNLIARSRRAN